MCDLALNTPPNTDETRLRLREHSSSRISAYQIISEDEWQFVFQTFVGYRFLIEPVTPIGYVEDIHLE